MKCMPAHFQEECRQFQHQGGDMLMNVELILLTDLWFLLKIVVIVHQNLVV